MDHYSFSVSASAFDDGHDVVLAEDEQVVAVDLYLGARILAEEDLVALLDIQRDEFADFVSAAGTDGNDFALLRFFAGCVRHDKPTGCLGLSVSTLNDNAVVKGAEIHIECSKVVAPRTRRRKKAELFEICGFSALTYREC